MPCCLCSLDAEHSTFSFRVAPQPNTILYRVVGIPMPPGKWRMFAMCPVNHFTSYFPVCRGKIMCA